MRTSLLAKLLFSVLLPTVLTFGGFALLSHLAARRALEAELGRKLADLATITAAQINDESVGILVPGDEGSRTYRNLRRKLLDIKAAIGLSRLAIFAADHKIIVDTNEVPIGSLDYTLDASRAELKRVFAPAEAQATSSVLFQGRDGLLYKSGFAPIRVTNTPPRFAISVEGNAALFGDLVALRRTLLSVGAIGCLAMVVLATLIGLRVTGPLRRLGESARLIGGGVFDQPLQEALRVRQVRLRDEVADLVDALDGMREALRLRDDRLQMMLAGIAHEVRNPLGGMELFAGLLAEELAQGRDPATGPPVDLEAAQGYVQRVRKELSHLQAVVTEFLEYARRPPPAQVPVDLDSLLAEVAECARADAVTASGPHPQVVLALASPGLAVCGDPTQLRRALLNLAKNAVAACQSRQPPAASPRVELGATLHKSADSLPSSHRIILWVRDDGPGIPEEVQQSMWTPFFTTRAQGTGLGLAFVREIIADHGGHITVQSSPAGTCFTLELRSASQTRSP